MGERPLNRFPAPLFVVRDCVVESEFEASLGRVGHGLHAIFEIGPSDGLAIAIALQAAKALRSQEQSWSVLG